METIIFIYEPEVQQRIDELKKKILEIADKYTNKQFHSEKEVRENQREFLAVTKIYAEELAYIMNNNMPISTSINGNYILLQELN